MNRLIQTFVLAAFAHLLLAAAALAAPKNGGPEIGQNLGELLSSWAEPLFIGIAALISLVFLVNRRYGELAVFLVAAMVVGGFVLAPESIAATVQSMWQTMVGR